MDLAWRQAPSMTERITKPIFLKQHYDAIAELIGQKIVYGFMDEKDYSIIEVFAEMFAQDNPAIFDKDRFRDAVYEAHSRRKSRKEGNSNSVPDK
ncbi:MAG: hypothetical protein M3288_03935 [Thermoproteota archaeon]|nr:hypothetical protein [Thermoproteota archaeon]